jgi:hypothetical protein
VSLKSDPHPGYLGSEHTHSLETQLLQDTLVTTYNDLDTCLWHVRLLSFIHTNAICEAYGFSVTGFILKQAIACRLFSTGQSRPLGRTSATLPASPRGR